MIKAISLSLLLFVLAVQNSYSQTNVAVPTATDAIKSEKAAATEEAELSVSAAEQADRDLLIPREVQEKLAVENANKPISYGKGTTPYHRKPVSKYSSRKKTYTKRRR